MKMPFGKHAGEDLTDIPLDYLKWLEERDVLDRSLRMALQFEIERRQGDLSSLGRVIRRGDGK